MRSVGSKRRPYVTDPDMCRVCRHGINGCPSNLAHPQVVACIGYLPAMEQV